MEAGEIFFEYTKLQFNRRMYLKTSLSEMAAIINNLWQFLKMLREYFQKVTDT